ncbi:helix-turn-helix transcriptional regulator [Streptosporangium sp. NBC_01756]|uniref:helix-turn-helix transcriptional regulator n=1 Tax=Streptosporangium sp. NBC_01756 TaxID=2975950 RepID=UPI002DD7E6A0|nr:helix-turn-helix transcriptional regulator [Streptosporangium sp. NBC_01756]WSC89724.1 helix-turn-helix transcriptional regulator [Streptosporangium sp. NBC_01756]
MYPGSALGEFLRSRRARLQPEELGLSLGVRRRRVAGLRREEVAPLAGVSVGYYTRLEQGQSPNVSDEVLDAIARVLRLDEDEVAHLHRLARVARARERSRPERLRPGIKLMVDSFAGVPAIAVGRRGDILAWNRMAHALLGPHWDYDGEKKPNFVLMDFLEMDFARELYVDWEQKARDDIAYLEGSIARFPGDEELTGLIDELLLLSPDFRTMWTEHPVSNCASISRDYRHREVGVMTLTAELLRTPDDEGQGVTVFQAEPGSPSAERLRRLAELVDAAAG